MKLYSEQEILDLINSTGLSYTDHGHYIKFRCINPLHTDTKPSMMMLKENGFATCWSCGYKLHFTKLYYQLTGKKLLKETQNDLEFFKQEKKIQDKQKPEKHKRNLKIYSGKLLDVCKCDEALNYLYSININMETINTFNIRFTKQAEISFDPKLEKGTKIYNRILIPIIENEKLVNIECRDYTLKSKFKVIYPKGSKADVLFNYDNLDKNRPLIVVEGVKSALRIWQQLDKNVTATFGSSIGKNQKEKLNEFKNIILFPDNDNAGKIMADQFKEYYNYDHHIAFMEKENYDPADGTIEDVKYALNNMITNQKYFIERRLLI